MVSLFAELEGHNWNHKSKDRISSFNNKPVYPVRREYIYNSHWEELEEKYFPTRTIYQAETM